MGFLKNMAGLIEEVKNPSPCLNPNSKRGGMATHAGVALELGITRAQGGPGGMKMMSPQMEAILIWCQCRVRNYKIPLRNFTSDWANGVAFCALIHNFSHKLLTLPKSILPMDDKTMKLHSK